MGHPVYLSIYLSLLRSLACRGTPCCPVYCWTRSPCPPAAPAPASAARPGTSQQQQSSSAPNTKVGCILISYQLLYSMCPSSTLQNIRPANINVSNNVCVVPEFNVSTSHKTELRCPDLAAVCTKYSVLCILYCVVPSAHHFLPVSDATCDR